MKLSTVLILGAVGVGGYFLYKRYTASATPTSTLATWLGSFNPQNRATTT